jgi:hypothetical protein
MTVSELQTVIGKYDAVKKSVPVTFTLGDIIHKRSVNAVLCEQGKYKRAETAARVAEVADGVAAKIACGAIVAQPEPELAPPAEPAPE